MLATRDQENLAYTRHAGVISKQHGARTMAPKTPGARFTDENAVRAGKNILQSRTRGQENALTSKGGNGANKAVGTPLETRPRAVLGDKTTNAKARTNQTGRVKDVVQELEKTQLKPTTHRNQKIKQVPLEAINVEPVNARDDDVEHVPKHVPDLPYESDVFPRGGLTFEALKPKNRLQGYYRHYYDPIDENGISLKEQRYEQEMRAVLDKGERKILKEVDELDWSVPDIPTTSNVKKPSKFERKAPLTIASRGAAVALSMPINGSLRLPRQAKANPVPTKTTRTVPKKTLPIQKHSRIESAMSVAASRSTLGYSRGRALLQKTKTEQNEVEAATTEHPVALAPRTKPGLPRSSSTVSTDSDKTITPSMFAQGEADDDLSKRLDFLSIFEPQDDESDGIHNCFNTFAGVDDDEEVNIQIL